MAEREDENREEDDVEVDDESRTGEEQAAINRENDPPA